MREHDEVGVEPRRDPPLSPRHADHQRRIEGRHTYRAGQAHGQPAGRVRHHPVHGEGAAGEGAVGATGHAVLHPYLLAPQVEGAVGQAGQGDGIGDEHRPLRAFGAQQQLHGAGVDVDAVGDELHSHVPRVEGGRQAAGVAVVEEAHAVVAMGDVPDAEGEGALGLLIGGVAVGEADDHPRCHGLSDDRLRPGELRRQAYEAQVSARRLQVGAELLDTGLRQPFPPEGAGTFGAEEGPLEMKAQRLRPLPHPIHDGPGGPYLTEEVVAVTAYRGDQERRYPRADGPAGEGAGLLEVVARQGEAAATVHMQIDEAGRDDEAAEVEGVSLGRRRIRAGLDDPPSREHDRPLLDLLLGGNDAGMGQGEGTGSAAVGHESSRRWAGGHLGYYRPAGPFS